MKQLYKRISTFSLLTLLSRILGFARDIVWAIFFGATGHLDAFLVAFKIPNFMRRLFAEGAFTQSFLPVLVEYTNQSDKSTTLTFINRLVGNMAAILGALSIIVLATAPWIIASFAPGFISQPEKWQLASSMLRFTFPYLVLISLTALIGAILNHHRHFAAPAFAPVLLNLSFIICAYLLFQPLASPIYALAIAVPIAGVLQLALQLAVLARYQSLPRPRICLNDPGTMQVLKRLAPAILGISVTQISLLIDTLIASLLPSGSISWLYYSERLIHFPQGMFGVAIATIIMPELSEAFTQRNQQSFDSTLQWAIQNVMLISIPASLGLAMLAGPIISTLFQHGHFTIHDVMMARYSLWAYCCGLPAFMLIKVLTSAYYARHEVKTPVYIALGAVGVNIVLNLILIGPMAHAGLALATSLASWLNACLLIYRAKQTYGQVAARSGQRNWPRLVVTNSFMVALLYLLTPKLNAWLHWSVAHQSISLGLLVMAAVITYSIGLWLTGFRLQHLKAR